MSSFRALNVGAVNIVDVLESPIGYLENMNSVEFRGRRIDVLILGPIISDDPSQARWAVACDDGFQGVRTLAVTCEKVMTFVSGRATGVNAGLVPTPGRKRHVAPFHLEPGCVVTIQLPRANQLPVALTQLPSPFFVPSSLKTGQQLLVTAYIEKQALVQGTIGRGHTIISLPLCLVRSDDLAPQVRDLPCATSVPLSCAQQPAARHDPSVSLC